MKSEDAQAMQLAANVLKVLSNPKRLAILCYIGESELSVNDIAARVGISQSALSQHLSKLRQADMVECRREHNKIYYSLSSKKTEMIIALLRELYCRNLEGVC